MHDGIAAGDPFARHRVLVADLLIADRFVALTPTRWFDLGTGERALLRVEPLAAMDAQASWADRCALLCGLWHPALAPCIDFGVIGDTHRFEAYRTHSRLPAPAAARAAHAQVVEQFLDAAGVPLPRVVDAASARRARCALVPVSGSTREDLYARQSSRRTSRSSSIGLRLVPRRVMAAIGERLDAEPPPGWSIVEIAAAAGSGGRTLLEWCAREARRRGWVPVSSTAWPAGAMAGSVPAWVRLLEGRHVLLLHDGRHLPADDRRVSRMLLHLAAARGSRHLIVRLVLPGRTHKLLELDAVPDPELSSAVIAVGYPRGLARRVADALRTAHGLPGAFVATLFGRRPRERAPAACVVHEAAVPYRVPEDQTVYDRVATISCGDPFEVREGLVKGLCSRGRHAAAERMVRREYAAAVRRGRSSDAAERARLHAALSRRRGRSDEAREWLSRAAGHCAAAGDARAGALVAVEQAHAHVDRLDLDAADAAARAGEAAATLHGDRLVQCAAWLARARIAWWRGRSAEVSALANLVAARQTPAHRHGAFAAVWSARAAIASGDLQAARAAIRRARDLAIVHDEVHPAIALAEAAWFVASGDLDSLARAVSDVRRGCATPRRALAAVIFDALAVEGPLLHGEAPGHRCLGRLHRRAKGRLPPLLGARLELAVLQAIEPSRAGLRRRQLSESGAHAFLHVLPGVPRRIAGRARSPMLDDVVAVLRMCQEHEDPLRALEQLARFVLEHGRCAGVAIVAGARAPALVAALPNLPAPPASARRAIESGTVIGPEHLDGAVEVAVPVRCAALTIGAIACRWLEAPPLESGFIVSWLNAVAVACAPCIQAVVDRLDPPALPLVAQELLGESLAIHEVRRAVARTADAPYPVLIEGESGVGKELVARAIHGASRRRSRPFAALNCAALPDELIEAELFGHARGAFTGALVERRGLFEEADAGVLFLDEVGELSARAQAKLLRALQEGEIRRIGETHARRVDVRIVAATNRTLAGEVEQGRFRRDLWYRLDVIHLRVPPLRERPDDVALLARAFWQRASERVGSRAVLGPAVLAALARYDWPGNVRELQNVIAALAVAAPRRGIVPGSCLPESLARLAEQRTAVTLDAARRGFETRYVRAALARAGGHRGRAATELGLTRQGLLKLLERLGLEPDDDSIDAAGHPG